MKVIPPTSLKNNKLSTRLEAVSSALQTNRLLIDGQGCPTLKLGLMGKYTLVKTDKGDPEPLKDKFSDVADCLQYLCLSLGEGRRMIGIDPALPIARAQVYKRHKSLRRIVA